MDTNYVFTEEAQKRLTILHNYLEAGFPVFLEGPTGTSKTLSSEMVCKLSGRKLIKLNLHYVTKLADIVGQYDGDADSGEIVFHSKGPFIIAFEEGYTLLLESYKFASFKFKQFFSKILHNGIIFVELPGMPLRVIHIHENCRFIVTNNPRDGNFFVYKYSIDVSLLSGFHFICYPDFTRHELIEIAQGYATKLNYKFPSKLIDNLVDFHMEWSKCAYKDDTCFTIRQIITTIRALSNKEDIYETIMTIYGARYTKYKREELRKFLTHYFVFENPSPKKFIYPKEFPNCFKNDSLSHALKSVLFSLKNKRHVLLVSDDGAGVTQLSRWILQYFNKINASEDDFCKKYQEFFYECNEETNCSDLFGRQIVSDSMDSDNKLIKWKFGFLTKAIKRGKIAVLDKIKLAPIEVIGILKDIMDQKFDDKIKYFDVPGNPKKQKVEINENFCLLCTCSNGISEDLQSFFNRFDIIFLEDQLENISPTDLKELIKFLLHTTNFEKWRSPFNHNEQNQNHSDIEYEDDGLKSEIGTSKITYKQKQPDKNLVEQFNPTTDQINLVYNNIGKTPSFTKEQAMNVGKYMFSINNLHSRILPKWSLNDVKNLFQRIHFQDIHPDRFLNIKIYHNILFYTMSPINKSDEKDILPIVIDLIGNIYI